MQANVWCEFFSEGFFGYGQKGDFQYGSIWHILPIVLLLAGIFFTYRYRKQIKSWKHEEGFRFILAFVILMAEMSYFWRLLYVGSSNPEEHNLMDKLPLQVCEWSAFLSAFMLCKKSRGLYDVCFYICCSLGLIPIITPAVISRTGPGYYRYYQFWLEHILPVYGVAYMTIVHGFVSKRKMIYKPALLLLALGVFAIPANLAYENANYLYLAANTDGASIANLLPANIWLRAGIYACIVLAAFFLVSMVLPLLRKHFGEQQADAKNCAPSEITTKN